MSVHKQQMNTLYQTHRVHDLLCKIEDLTQVMAHEDDRIKEKLKKWQDGEILGSMFVMTLTRYFDELND